MQSKPENRIYHSFKSWSKRDGFLHVFEDIHFHRVETGRTELGVPDIYYEYTLFTGWIEQKYIVWPKRKLTSIEIDWQPLQQQWLRNNVKRTKNNSRTCLAVIDNNRKIRLFSRFNKSYSQEEFLHYGQPVKNIEEIINFLKNIREGTCC